MEMIIDNMAQTLISILNYQPVIMFGIGVRVFHLVMFYFCMKLFKGLKGTKAFS